MGRRKDKKRRDRRRERSKEAPRWTTERGEGPSASAHWGSGFALKPRDGSWSVDLDFAHGIDLPFDPDAEDPTEGVGERVRSAVEAIREGLPAVGATPPQRRN